MNLNIDIRIQETEVLVTWTEPKPGSTGIGTRHLADSDHFVIYGGSISTSFGTRWSQWYKYGTGFSILSLVSKAVRQNPNG